MVDYIDENANELDELVFEYELLGHVKAAIGLALAAELSVTNSQTWLDRVRFIFDSLRRHIERMFRLEELGGHLSEAHERAALMPRLQELRADHQRLQEALTQMLAALHAAKPEDLSRLGQLRAQMQELVAQIDRHEQQETRIVKELFWRDARGQSG